jgi:hypothetical protein
MKLPRYWSRGTAEELDDDGQPVSFTCWRSSETSAEEARGAAMTAARRIVDCLRTGKVPSHYLYGDRPLREEILEEFTNEQGERIAAVTQNSYGVLVLNTAQAMFIDIDFPPITLWSLLTQMFGRLFGRESSSAESDAQTRLAAFLGEHPEFGWRVYRTCAGLRLLVTHAPFDPTADATRRLLQEVGADPLYVRLCQAQECFRARLTPKPWRCGHYANPIPWPREEKAQQRAFEAWQEGYLKQQANFATCRLMVSMGHPTIHPDVAPIIEVHDRLTRSATGLELA